MNNQPTQLSIRAMYNSFIKKWGTEDVPDFKLIEKEWVEILNGLSDEQVRIITDFLVEEMNGFPGFIHIDKYAVSLRNNAPVEMPLEEKVAMEIINHVCEKYSGDEYQFRISDAIEIAASVLYVHDHSGVELEQETINDTRILPRKSLFLNDVSRWVTDAYEGKGQWVDTLRKINGAYKSEY